MRYKRRFERNTNFNWRRAIGWVAEGDTAKEVTVHLTDVKQDKSCDFLEMVQFHCHKQRLEMTKTELQTALAAATQTNKKTAGVFLDTLSNLAYKAIKKEGEFVLPGFGKLVKQKRKARMGFNPKTQEKIKIPAKTVVKFRVAKVAKDAILGAKK